MATYYGRKYKMLEWRHRVKELILSIRIALKSKELGKPETGKQVFVAMVDGEAFHGGMCDRFKGIISLYAYCKYHGIPFRIRYTYPFRLEDYLEPATYDWTLKPGEYTDNPLYSRILYMRGEHLATRLLKLKTKRQVHYYSNRDCLAHINEAWAAAGVNSGGYGWGELFGELFKPGAVLRGRIEAAKRNMGTDYDAAVFRFQNLLGDFREYHYKSITDQGEAEELICKCLDAIRSLKSEHDNRPLLVTSDSVTFLKRVSQIEGVHIIPGAIVHIDGDKNAVVENAYEIYLKSFLDFYMLSGARQIYRIGTSYMYPSEFPLYAAKLHDIPFKHIII